MGANTTDHISVGYRVLSVSDSGPMAAAGANPMLDFIIYPDDKPCSDALGLTLEETVLRNLGKALDLTLYNVASRSKRKIRVVPRLQDKSGALGATVRAENYLTAHLRVLHVISCLPGGPLAAAGFLPRKDYILGAEDRGFGDLDEFKDFIRAHDKNSVGLLVYNVDTNQVRKVSLTPDKDWGGEGFLGGDIGYGLAHALPQQEADTTTLKTESFSERRCINNGSSLIPSS